MLLEVSKRYSAEEVALISSCREKLKMILLPKLSIATDESDEEVNQHAQSKLITNHIKSNYDFSGDQ